MPIHFDEIPQPKTLREAVTVLCTHISPVEVGEVSYTKEWAVQAHHFFGTAMRNGWNLWATHPDKPKDLHQHFRDAYGLGHADDMSGMILKAFEHKLKGLAFDCEAEAEYYRQYWRKSQIDPLTQERV